MKFEFNDSQIKQLMGAYKDKQLTPTQGSFVLLIDPKHADYHKQSDYYRLRVKQLHGDYKEGRYFVSAGQSGHEGEMPGSVEENRDVLGPAQVINVPAVLSVEADPKIKKNLDENLISHLYEYLELANGLMGMNIHVHEDKDYTAFDKYVDFRKAWLEMLSHLDKAIKSFEPGSTLPKNPEIYPFLEHYHPGVFGVNLEATKEKLIHLREQVNELLKKPEWLSDAEKDLQANWAKLKKNIDKETLSNVDDIVLFDLRWKELAKILEQANSLINGTDKPSDTVISIKKEIESYQNIVKHRERAYTYQELVKHINGKLPTLMAKGASRTQADVNTAQYSIAQMILKALSRQIREEFPDQDKLGKFTNLQDLNEKRHEAKNKITAEFSALEKLLVNSSKALGPLEEDALIDRWVMLLRLLTVANHNEIQILDKTALEAITTRIKGLQARLKRINSGLAERLNVQAAPAPVPSEQVPPSPAPKTVSAAIVPASVKPSKQDPFRVRALKFLSLIYDQLEVNAKQAQLDLNLSTGELSFGDIRPSEERLKKALGVVLALQKEAEEQLPDLIRGLSNNPQSNQDIIKVLDQKFIPFIREYNESLGRLLKLLNPRIFNNPTDPLTVMYQQFMRNQQAILLAQEGLNKLERQAHLLEGKAEPSPPSIAPDDNSVPPVGQISPYYPMEANVDNLADALAAIAGSDVDTSDEESVDDNPDVAMSLESTSVASSEAPDEEPDLSAELLEKVKLLLGRVEVLNEQQKPVREASLDRNRKLNQKEVDEFLAGTRARIDDEPNDTGREPGLENILKQLVNMNVGVDQNSELGKAITKAIRVVSEDIPEFERDIVRLKDRLTRPNVNVQTASTEVTPEKELSNADLMGRILRSIDQVKTALVRAAEDKDVILEMGKDNTNLKPGVKLPEELTKNDVDNIEDKFNFLKENFEKLMTGLKIDTDHKDNEDLAGPVREMRSIFDAYEKILGVLMTHALRKRQRAVAEQIPNEPPVPPVDVLEITPDPFQDLLNEARKLYDIYEEEVEWIAGNKSDTELSDQAREDILDEIENCRGGLFGILGKIEDIKGLGQMRALGIVNTYIDSLNNRVRMLVVMPIVEAIYFSTLPLAAVAKIEDVPTFDSILNSHNNNLVETAKARQASLTRNIAEIERADDLLDSPDDYLDAIKDAQEELMYAEKLLTKNGIPIVFDGSKVLAAIVSEMKASLKELQDKIQKKLDEKKKIDTAAAAASASVTPGHQPEQPPVVPEPSTPVLPDIIPTIHPDSPIPTLPQDDLPPARDRRFVLDLNELLNQARSLYGQHDAHLGDVSGETELKEVVYLDLDSHTARSERLLGQEVNKDEVLPQVRQMSLRQVLAAIAKIQKSHGEEAAELTDAIGEVQGYNHIVEMDITVANAELKRREAEALQLQNMVSDSLDELVAIPVIASSEDSMFVVEVGNLRKLIAKRRTPIYRVDIRFEGDLPVQTSLVDRFGSARQVYLKHLNGVGKFTAEELEGLDHSAITNLIDDLDKNLVEILDIRDLMFKRLNDARQDSASNPFVQKVDEYISDMTLKLTALHELQEELREILSDTTTTISNEINFDDNQDRVRKLIDAAQYIRRNHMENVRTPFIEHPKDPKNFNTQLLDDLYVKVRSDIENDLDEDDLKKSGLKAILNELDSLLVETAVGPEFLELYLDYLDDVALYVDELKTDSDVLKKASELHALRDESEKHAQDFEKNHYARPDLDKLTVDELKAEMTSFLEKWRYGDENHPSRFTDFINKDLLPKVSREESAPLLLQLSDSFEEDVNQWEADARDHYDKLKKLLVQKQKVKVEPIPVKLSVNAKTEADNIGRVLKDPAKGRGIIRMNVDALEYIYTCLDSTARKGIYDQIDGASGHVQFTGFDGVHYSLFFDSPLVFDKATPDDKIKDMLRENVDLYLSHKGTRGIQPADESEARTSSNRYSNLFNRIKNNELLRIDEPVAKGKTAEFNQARELQEQSRFGRLKRTTELKRERYLQRFVMDIAQIDANAKLELPKDIDRRLNTARIAHNNKTKAAITNDEVAILTHKENVKYGSDTDKTSTPEDVFKLTGVDPATKKKFTKSYYMTKWAEAKPLVIEINNRKYLVTVDLFTHKKTGKEAVGYYKRDVTDLSTLSGINKHREKGDSPISNSDMDAYNSTHTGQSLSTLLKIHISDEVVQNTIKAPCLVIDEQKFDQEKDYSRGGPKP